MGKSAPGSLSRQLLIRILAWREQIAHSGDVDARTQAILAATLQGDGRQGSPCPAPPGPTAPRPGTVLVREHGGVLHRVTAVKGGYVWNDQTFASLSAVARAIAGTNWNGRRFFGLDRPAPARAEGATSRRLQHKSDGRICAADKVASMEIPSP